MLGEEISAGLGFLLLKINTSIVEEADLTKRGKFKESQTCN